MVAGTPESTVYCARVILQMSVVSSYRPNPVISLILEDTFRDLGAQRLHKRFSDVPLRYIFDMHATKISNSKGMVATWTSIPPNAHGCSRIGVSLSA